MSYANATHDRRYGGTILIDGKEVAETAQCVHCDGHFVMVKGSGRIRGWCVNCNGFVCGPACAACIPWEKKMELMEGKAVPDAIVSVPRSIGG